MRPDNLINNAYGRKKRAYDTRINLPRKFPHTGVFDGMACEQEEWNQAHPRPLAAEARKICPNDICSTYRKTLNMDPKTQQCVVGPHEEKKNTRNPSTDKHNTKHSI